MKTYTQLVTMAFTMQEEKRIASQGYPETRAALLKETKEELVNTILALTKMYYRATEAKEQAATSGKAN